MNKNKNGYQCSVDRVIICWCYRFGAVPSESTCRKEAVTLSELTSPTSLIHNKQVKREAIFWGTTIQFVLETVREINMLKKDGNID